MVAASATPGTAAAANCTSCARAAAAPSATERVATRRTATRFMAMSSVRGVAMPPVSACIPRINARDGANAIILAGFDGCRFGGRRSGVRKAFVVDPERTRHHRGGSLECEAAAPRRVAGTWRSLGGCLTGERVTRRLAAILAADVVGYSRLMGRDESGTHVRLREVRTHRLEPTLARRGGRLVKLTGDGALVEFASAVDALSAAIEFQQAMEEDNREQAEDTRIVFRIGLHLGDLIVDGDDLYGDGVNVAARLEAAAPPGGIAVSYSVRDAVAGRLNARFDDLGGLELKNIERPV
ncbi:MAG: adenylate/guanylate cyclase domain-containing protein [Alphaproteobacteria bacterium]|nr:adenylate/guanylate cyclase domain-containing protein [Alphaproteobacteria bacterium]